MATTDWSFTLTDSLEKIYVDGDPRPWDPAVPLSVFLGETASFQLAVRPPLDHHFRNWAAVRVDVGGTAGPFSTVHQVELVPCTVVAFPEHDAGYDRDTPGLYPDVLRPAPGGAIQPIYGHWTAAWIDITIDSAADAGRHSIPVTVTAGDGTMLYSGSVDLEVLPARLPELDIVNTHWFHCDGLANYYGVEVFSEDHWDIIEKFIASAARMDVNSLLTPTWTPPLDTAVGGLRTPTQLIGIQEHSGHGNITYDFDFSQLIRWMRLCAAYGIRYLEIAHLFTQWGATQTPAIYVRTPVGLQRRFGWDVDATAPEYRQLLEALLPALREVLSSHWSLERVIFHISDEPHGAEALTSYRQAKDVVADLLEGLTVVDALSDYDFYSTGAVPLPVVATDAVGPFLAAGVRDLWVYYCVAQDTDVANRFIGMPSSRSRVLGHQLFAFGCKGFLHWGFNFYNSAESLRPVDPFRDTCAGGGFTAGDAFMVYPGPEGEPLQSIRYRVFAQAMADHRAFQALAALRGRDAVMELIDHDGAGGALAFDRFSYDPLHYRRVRETVNQAIVEG